MTEDISQARNDRAEAERARPELAAVLPGLTMAAFGAGSAFFIAALSGIPAALCAILAGLAMVPAVRTPAYQAGLDIASGAVLRIAIVLLGARVSFADISALGWEPVLIVAVTISGGLCLSMLGARLLGLPKSLGWIAGMGVAICGVSAAMTAASLLPRSGRLNRDLLFVALSVTALSTLAMILYPIIARTIGLNDIDAGIFFGATIHDLAQVVGAGYSLSAKAGDAAVITKLIRVGALAPIALTAAVILGRSNGEGGRIAVPWFLVGFLTLSAVRSTGALPDQAVALLSEISGIGFLIAIAAIAMKARWRDLLECDARALALVMAHTLALAAATLVLLDYL